MSIYHIDVNGCTTTIVTHRHQQCAQLVQNIVYLFDWKPLIWLQKRIAHCTADKTIFRLCCGKISATASTSQSLQRTHQEQIERRVQKIVCEFEFRNRALSTLCSIIHYCFHSHSTHPECHPTQWCHVPSFPVGVENFRFRRYHFLCNPQTPTRIRVRILLITKTH